MEHGDPHTNSEWGQRKSWDLGQGNLHRRDPCSFTLSFVFDVIDFYTRHPLHRGNFIVTREKREKEKNESTMRKIRWSFIERFVRDESRQDVWIIYDSSGRIGAELRQRLDLIYHLFTIERSIDTRPFYFYSMSLIVLWYFVPLSIVPTFFKVSKKKKEKKKKLLCDSKVRINSTLAWFISQKVRVPRESSRRDISIVSYRVLWTRKKGYRLLA